MIHTDTPPALGSVTAIATLFALAGSAGAQSAQEVMDEALAHSDAQLENVRTVRVVQRTEVAGAPGVVDTVYLEKVTEGGHALLMPAEGEREISPTRMVQQIADGAEYGGTESVEGHETHVLVADEPDLRDWAGGAVDSMMAESNADVDVEVDEIRIFLDTESYVLRKVTVDLTLERDGKTSPAHHEQIHTDYETFHGMPYPRTRVLRTTGLTGALSPQQMAQMRQGMEEARRELEKLPEGQREMAEKYMADRMQAMGSEGMETVIQVLEVEVNGG